MIASSTDAQGGRASAATVNNALRGLSDGRAAVPAACRPAGSRAGAGRRLALSLRTASQGPFVSTIVALALIMAAAAPGLAAEGNVCVENMSIAELQQALAEGRTTATALTQAYLARIEAYDRAGPRLNAVREVNPDALAIAASLDRVKPSPRQPLAGIPILLKDNIATGDQQHTTAASLALADARAT